MLARHAGNTARKIIRRWTLLIWNKKIYKRRGGSLLTNFKQFYFADKSNETKRATSFLEMPSK